MERALRFEQDYPHPPAKVWKALTTREHLAAWLMPNDFEPRLGHRFQFRSKPVGGWDGIVNCEVLELVPEKRLVISWISNVIDTRVTFLVEPNASGGTRFTLLHTGFKGAKPIMTSFILGMGWKGIVKRSIPNLLSRLQQEGTL